jgi:hypothetical protein
LLLPADIAGGYPGRDKYLFNGFPLNVEWTLASLTIRELGAFRFAQIQEVGSRTDEELAVRALAEDPDVLGVGVLRLNICKLELTVAEGHAPSFGRVIATAEGPDKPHVLLEGYSRAIVLTRRSSAEEPIEALVG